LCAQEAQRAAKAANKQVSGQKQKDTTAIKEEPKKPLSSKIQTSGSNISKPDNVSATGKLLHCYYCMCFILTMHVELKILEAIVFTTIFQVSSLAPLQILDPLPAGLQWHRILLCLKLLFTNAGPLFVPWCILKISKT